MNGKEMWVWDTNGPDIAHDRIWNRRPLEADLPAGSCRLVCEDDRQPSWHSPLADGEILADVTSSGECNY